MHSSYTISIINCNNTTSNKYLIYKICSDRLFLVKITKINKTLTQLQKFLEWKILHFLTWLCISPEYTNYKQQVCLVPSCTWELQNVLFFLFMCTIKEVRWFFFFQFVFLYVFCYSVINLLHYKWIKYMEE